MKKDHFPMPHVPAKSAVLAIGGFNGGNLTDCNEYSLIKGTWSHLPILRVAMYGKAACVLKKYLVFTLGGYPYNTGYGAEMLDMSMPAMKWETIDINSTLF